jgi:hypothetical protein
MERPNTSVEKGRVRRKGVKTRKLDSENVRQEEYSFKGSSAGSNRESVNQAKEDVDIKPFEFDSSPKGSKRSHVSESDPSKRFQYSEESKKL